MAVVSTSSTRPEATRGPRGRLRAEVVAGHVAGGVVDTHALPPQVYWGRPAKTALPAALAKLGCKRAFLMVSSSLRRTTPAIDEITAGLGSACAGVWDGMPAHTPREAVILAAKAAKDAKADVIVTIGGGSLTDGAKVVRIAMAEGVTNVEGLEPLHFHPGDEKTGNALRSTPLIPQVSIPTTLSAGEFGPFAGVTDTAKRGASGAAPKEPYLYSTALPSVIVLDPALAAYTPLRLFLATGLRAVDHCVEALCSHEGNPYSDTILQGALRLLVRGLRRVKVEPTDTAAILLCQIAMWQAVQGCQSGPKVGASHAIGHVLGGTYEVPHGETSCVALPAVLAWNAQDTLALQRQRLVCEVFCELAREEGGELGAREAGHLSASQHVGGLIKQLGLPASLSEVGLRREQLEDCARRTMQDRFTASNPRRISDWSDVLQILELAL